MLTDGVRNFLIRLEGGQSIGPVIDRSEDRIRQKAKKLGFARYASSLRGNKWEITEAGRVALANR